MSATVFDITGRIRARLARPIAAPQRARNEVAARLQGKGVQPKRIEYAQNRAERSVWAGFEVEPCVQRAVAWALSDDEVHPIARAPSTRSPYSPQPPLLAG